MFLCFVWLMTKCLPHFTKLISKLDLLQPNWRQGNEIVDLTIRLLQNEYCKTKRQLQREIARCRILEKVPIPKKTPKKYIKLSEKDKMVEKINKFIKDSGYEPDEFLVFDLVDETLTYTENMNIFKEQNPIFKALEKEQKLKLEKYAAMCDMNYTQLDKAHLDNFGYQQLLEMLESIFNEISTRTDYDFLGDIVERLRSHAEKDKFVWDISKMQPKP